MEYSFASITISATRSACSRLLGRLASKPLEYSARLLAQITFVLCLSTAAFAGTATEFEFQFGHWLGKPEVSPNGQFQSCMISEHNDSDELLIFRFDKENVLTLGVFEKEWQGKIPTQLQALVMVDHQILHFGMALLFASDALVIELDDPASSLKTLVNGKLLSIGAQDESAIFSLAGADMAVAYLQRCALRGLGGVRQNKKVSYKRGGGVLGRTDLPPLIQRGSAVVLEIVPAEEVSLLNP
jgi:hypothetical protein